VQGLLRSIAWRLRLRRFLRQIALATHLFRPRQFYFLAYRQGLRRLRRQVQIRHSAQIDCLRLDLLIGLRLFGHPRLHPLLAQIRLHQPRCLGRLPLRRHYQLCHQIRLDCYLLRRRVCRRVYRGDHVALLGGVRVLVDLVLLGGLQSHCHLHHPLDRVRPVLFHLEGRVVYPLNPRGLLAALSLLQRYHGQTCQGNTRAFCVARRIGFFNGVEEFLNFIKVS